jgi:hypothetical protein
LAFVAQRRVIGPNEDEKDSEALVCVACLGDNVPHERCNYRINSTDVSGRSNWRIKARLDSDDRYKHDHAAESSAGLPVRSRSGSHAWNAGIVCMPAGSTGARKLTGSQLLPPAINVPSYVTMIFQVGGIANLTPAIGPPDLVELWPVDWIAILVAKLQARWTGVPAAISNVSAFA